MYRGGAGKVIIGFNVDDINSEYKRLLNLGDVGSASHTSMGRMLIPVQRY